MFNNVFVKFALGIGCDSDTIFMVGAVSGSFAWEALEEESVFDVQRTKLGGCSRIRELLVGQGH